MPLVIAHRGASKRFRENTIEAFEGARALGADWVELDARTAACGTLVVHHDEIVDGDHLISATDAKDLPEYVPTLEDALGACEGMGVNIELKNDPSEESFDPEHLMARPFVRLVRRTLPLSRILISSFDMPTLNAVRDLDPALPTAFLTSATTGPDVACGRAVAHGHGAVNPADALVTTAWTRVASENELALNVWTVDDPKRIKRLADLGIDGIITNVPDVAREALGA